MQDIPIYLLILMGQVDEDLKILLTKINKTMKITKSTNETASRFHPEIVQGAYDLAGEFMDSEAAYIAERKVFSNLWFFPINFKPKDLCTFEAFIKKVNEDPIKDVFYDLVRTELANGILKAVEECVEAEKAEKEALEQESEIFLNECRKIMN